MCFSCENQVMASRVQPHRTFIQLSDVIRIYACIRQNCKQKCSFQIGFCGTFGHKSSMKINATQNGKMCGRICDSDFTILWKNQRTFRIFEHFIT